MKAFIWEGVPRLWLGSCVVALGKSVEEARKVALAELRAAALEWQDVNDHDFQALEREPDRTVTAPCALLLGS